MGATHSSNKILPEICMIRLVLVFMVIIYHSFCPFIGSPFWMPIMDNAPDEYYYIARWAYAFMLEAFTFISGYIYGYQIFNGRHEISIKSTIISKAKRLLIPSFVFSLLYILSFNAYNDYGLGDWALNILNGAGHLWYLPMLFWCFVGIYFIEKNHINFGLSISFLFLASILSIYSLPFRITEASYYMIFFYMGYMIKRTPFRIKTYAKPLPIIGSWLAFISLFLCNILIVNTLPPP